MSTADSETAIVVAMRRSPTESDENFGQRESELIGLCEAAGGRVMTVIVQERPTVEAATYLGSGKMIEVADAAESAELIVFDAELTPAQVRNIETRVPCRVVDRTQLILDIFALRAHSRAGRLQVEIAQLQYLLPRLTGHGRALSRLGGGIGTRGPGETKLETDRRRIRDRIARLRQDLRTLEKRRLVQRDKRVRAVPVVALVGYTNAGKTTVLQRWTADRSTHSAAAGENRLFDTLDPLARRVKAGTTKDLVLLDTVGFVQDLPHLLVEAFKSTLEEVLEADLIVHVVDGAVDSTHRMETTYDVLDKIGAGHRPVLTFYNKMDVATVRPSVDVRAEATVFGSAATGDGMADLYVMVDKLLGFDAVTLRVSGRPLPQFWDLLAKNGRVLSTEDQPDGHVEVALVVERRYVDRVKRVLESHMLDSPALLENAADENGEAWFS